MSKWLTGKTAKLIVFALSMGILWICIEHWKIITLENALNGLKQTAFVVTGFIIAAFNLRFKLVEAMIGPHFSSRQMAKMRSLFQRCRDRLTSYIFYCVATATAMSVFPLVGDSHPISLWLSILGWGLFVHALHGYLLVLTSFNELEDGMFDKSLEDKRSEKVAELLED